MMQETPLPSELREGKVRTINGRRWTLVNGQPVELPPSLPKSIGAVLQQPSKPTPTINVENLARQAAVPAAAGLASMAAVPVLTALGAPIGAAAGTSFLTRTVAPLLAESAAAGAGAYGAARATGMPAEQAEQAGMFEGAIQGISGAVGRAVGNVAERAYRSSVLQSEPSRKQYGDVAGRLYKTNTPLTEGAFERVEQRIDKLVAQQDALLNDVKNSYDPRWYDSNLMSGGKFTPEVASEFTDYLTALNRVDPDAAAKAATKFSRRMQSLLSRPEFSGDAGADVLELLETKRQFQKMAQDAYARVKANPGAQLTPDEMFNVGMASYFKKQLDKIPDIAEINKQIVPLIGEARVLEQSLNRLSKHTPIGGPSDWTTLGFMAALGGEVPAVGGAIAKLFSWAPTRGVGSLGLKYLGKGIEQAPTMLRVGEIVTIAGQKVLITKKNEDGTVEGRPVRNP